MRAARSVTGSRRTDVASRLTRPETRTGRSRTSRTSPPTPSSGGAANGTSSRRRTRRRSSSICCASSGTVSDRTFRPQIHRESPFSLWDWRQYHAKGIPDLHRVQQALEVLLVIGAVAAAFFPRRKSPLQLAALTAALLIGFELVLTHWFYLYIPWFFPFVAVALLAPVAVPATVEEAEPSGHPVGELVPAG